jgi:TPR repeat protein
MNWTDKIRETEEQIESFRQTMEELRKYEPQGEDLIGGLDWSKEPDLARYERARAMLASDNFLARDTSSAISELEELASQGSVASMWRLGWTFAHGKGVPVDKARAEYWLRQGAERKSIAMCRNLAGFYMEDSRFTEARPLVEFLAEQNFPTGIENAWSYVCQRMGCRVRYRESARFFGTRVSGGQYCR